MVSLKRDGVVRHVVCACCKFEDVLIAGARHFDSVMLGTLAAMGKNHPLNLYPRELVEEGFIDQFGTFLTRAEAMELVKRNGQPFDSWANNYVENIKDSPKLYSEGLYPTCVNLA